MPDFGIMRGFGAKLFSDKLMAGQLPTQLGKIGSEKFGFVGLLDDYPNAAAAYALRLLRIGYTGYAIRVRRSSDNAEQDIGFVLSGLDYILDTSSLTSFCGAGNGFVTTWYDQSGNGRNATQTTASSQPQIVSAGNVILQNSKASIKFDSQQKFQYTVASLNFSSFAQFTVYNHYANSNYTRIFSKSIGNSVDYNLPNSIMIYKEAIGNNSTSQIVINNSGSGTSYNGYTITNNNSYLDTSNYDGVNLIRKFNLVQLSASPSYTILSRTYDKFAIGGAVNGAGETTNANITEVVFYGSNQSANLLGIQTNINTYYGIY